MTQRKNVLFIVIDQLRADCLFGALSEVVEMPNLRALMDDSATFTRNFSVTNPCGPARASLLTGQYAMNHRSVRNGTPLRHDIPNLATEVRKAGYLPLLFGYTDTSQDPRAFPEGDPALTTYEYVMNGFHEVTEMRMEMSYPWRAHLLAQGYELDDYAHVFAPVAASTDDPTVTDPAFYKAEDSDTAFLTDSFLNEMSARTDQNWFAHLTYIRPHPPLVAPAPYNTLYDPADLPAPAGDLPREDEAARHPFLDGALDNFTTQDCVDPSVLASSDADFVQSLRAVYFGLATEVDHHIGRVVDFLKESGQYEDTLVVVTADHGEMLGDRQAWGKMACYNAAYHTPLIIRDPTISSAHGQVFDQPTESIDIMPSILDWMELDVPTSVDGSSLMPLLRGSATPNRKNYTYSELDFGNPLEETVWQKRIGLDHRSSNLCILREEYLTLVHFNGGLSPLLFDHRHEGEDKDVSQDPDYQDDLLRLTRKILDHRMSNAEQTFGRTMITEKGPVTRPR